MYVMFVQVRFIFKQAIIGHLSTILPFKICREMQTIASYNPKRAMRFNSSHNISMSVIGQNGQERELFHHARAE